MYIRTAFGLVCLGSILLSGLAMAQEGTPIEAPPLPPAMHSGEALEPEVVIRQEGTDTVYEYRVGGKLIMVKVQPKGAPPYYFFDRDGDGTLETRTDDPRKLPNINQWVLFRW